MASKPSEAVPFYRAVRAEKRGREATPPWAKPPPSSAVGKPPSCCRGFASVSQLLLTKLLLTLTDLVETGTGGLLVKPQRQLLSFSILPPGGRAIKHERGKILVFWPF